MARACLTSSYRRSIKMKTRILSLPTMKKHALLYVFVVTAVATSSSALAGAGQTGAGVTTTTGTIDPTTATQNVQSQSSNFVQENQAMQAGQASPSGTAISAATGTAASRTGAAGTTQNSDPATGKPGDPNNPAANAQPSAPAAPAAPPPEYVSNIKKVNRDATPTGVAVVDSAATTGAVAGAKSSTPVAATVANSTPADNVMGAPAAQRQNGAATPRAPRAADATKVGATDRMPQQPVTPATGSGTAPDSFAFYIGIGIAGLLLAFAASTFFRSDKGSAK